MTTRPAARRRTRRPGTYAGQVHLPSWIEPAHLISSYGTIGLILIVFAETGLLIGFFLPGDSLLVLAGAYVVFYWWTA